jgi:glycopeptide antibiotics resistance protein
MVQLWRSFGGLVPLLVLIVVCLVVLLPAIARSSRQRRRSVINTFLGSWVIGVAAVTLSPAAGQRGRALESIPFKNLADLVTNSVDWQVPVAQIGGNILLFAPLGILLIAQAPGVTVAAGLRRTGLIAAAAALVIEIAQYVLGFGRVASVDDIILAVVGAAIGTFIAAAVADGLTPVATREAALKKAR